MTTPSSQQVLEVLGRIKDPDLGRDVVSLGMIKDLDVSPQGKVSFTFELTTPACPVRDQLKDEAYHVVMAIPGMETVDIKMEAEVPKARGAIDKAAIEGIGNIRINFKKALKAYEKGLELDPDLEILQQKRSAMLDILKKVRRA